jgi:tetratricopeptide (TPR) repeat protein
MNRPCDKVELFVDGELPLREADAFRDHIADCVNCQREMTSLMQLKLLGHNQVERVGVRQPEEASGFASFLRGWRLWGLAAITVPALALLALLMVNAFSQVKPRTDVWLVKRPERLLEARVSYPAADLHRPHGSEAMGGADSLDELPFTDMGLLKDHDQHGLVAAYLVRDDKGLAGRALKELETLGDSPDMASDRAVALMLQEKYQDALRVLDAALGKQPLHPQALWNRGIVLRELGLPLHAAEAFSQVAALKEPGWAEEAEKKVKELRNPTLERRKNWKENSKQGGLLLDAVPDPSSTEFKQLISFPSTRRYFYEAVRVATTREQVLKLQFLAQKLDERAGGNVLESYVLRVSNADFSRRAPLGQGYRALLRGNPSSQDKEQLLARLLESKEDDILLGLIPKMDMTEQRLKLFETKALASRDPWFQLLATELRAVKDVSWDPDSEVSRDARRLCEGRELVYLCISLELELSNIYRVRDQIDLAREHADAGLGRAREVGEWHAEKLFLWNLAQFARLSRDADLNRAYLMEVLAHDPEMTRRVHQELAVMAMQDLQIDEARREIDAALATGQKLGLPGVFALADISRLESAPDDEKHLNESLEALKLTLGKDEQMIATHVQGRFIIEREAQKGRELLWDAIKSAETQNLEENAMARRARAYSFTSLMLEAGKRGDFPGVLSLLERERKMELPRKCLLVAVSDSERRLFLARGADEGLVGDYAASRSKPLPQQFNDGDIVPRTLLNALEPCARVDVLARSPLHGREGLLPSRMAWSYLTRSSPPRAPRLGSALHLVVSEVKLPENTELKRLNTWTPSFGPDEQRRLLSGAEATPSRVLEAMTDATEIDLVAHGTLDDLPDNAYLMLAPEPGGSKLGVAAVRKASLKGAPFVVLAACHAAHATYSVDDPFSLPAAFIDAGARGVLAATVQIPDLEAQDFFNAVRERMRAGAAPAVALRDERLRWQGLPRGQSWLDKVLLFE